MRRKVLYWMAAAKLRALRVDFRVYANSVSCENTP